ncbi:putative 2-aminoethylphosphonate ABC transporter ATP-binding protein [Pleurocapsa sp. FMAR1]|uniref:putative 2-aminoethylphosphonate ABC transporter ATP-binding protein n=1 Tax=Pleurocapsa sp. FMAR1 TaxID=3040204 RepID=UPI0029C8BBF0|nr:putative 2-aminoethylphosphonate ABC transporter ATP-binding protein [Pleurocapsa sp. FMAR1]
MTYPSEKKRTFRTQSDIQTAHHSAVAIQNRHLSQPYLQVENVYKNFGNFTALKEIFLDVYPGEFVCMLGPSGCGKTTLLKIIAGLEEHSSGRIIQDGKDVSNLPPSKRDFGIVFQSYALFPNLTAAQNIAYGLENAKQSKPQIKARVSELLDMVGMGGLEKKYPAQMSGGQQQRVALARALAQSPGLLLLDEPLSALDAKVRVRLRTEIAQLQKRLGITTVMVTHDQEEALAMGDRVVVMDKGYIAQVGTPHAIYQQPNTAFVADFIGTMNFLPGQVVEPGKVRCGTLSFDVPQRGINVGDNITVAIRPEDILPLSDENMANLPNVYQATIEGSEFLGSSYLVILHLAGSSQEKLSINLSINQVRNLDLNVGNTLTIQLPPELIQIFPE